MQKIQIHPLFWGVAGLAILTGYFWELIALFSIVFFHEMGHAIAAQYFSWKIQRIKILPFGGICQVDEHGNKPMKEEFMIIIAGPMQHGLIAFLIIILQRFSIITPEYAHLLFQFNLMILLFNLLPIWPLDGGKLVQLFLASQKPYLDAYKQSLISSCIILIGLHVIVILFAPYNMQLWLVLSYLYIGLWTGWKQHHFTFMRFLLERHYGKQHDLKLLQPIDAKGEDFLYPAMEKFRRDCKHIIHVGGGNTLLGKLDENELMYAYFTEKQVNAKLKEIVYYD